MLTEIRRLRQLRGKHRGFERLEHSKHTDIRAIRIATGATRVELVVHREIRAGLWRYQRERMKGDDEKVNLTFAGARMRGR